MCSVEDAELLRTLACSPSARELVNAIAAQVRALKRLSYLRRESDAAWHRWYEGGSQGPEPTEEEWAQRPEVIAAKEAIDAAEKKRRLCELYAIQLEEN